MYVDTSYFLTTGACRAYKGFNPHICHMKITLKDFSLIASLRKSNLCSK